MAGNPQSDRVQTERLPDGGNWLRFPRIAAGLAARSLRRALPLIRRDPTFGVPAREAGHVLALANAFAGNDTSPTLKASSVYERLSTTMPAAVVEPNAVRTAVLELARATADAQGFLELLWTYPDTPGAPRVMRRSAVRAVKASRELQAMMLRVSATTNDGAADVKRVQRAWAADRRGLRHLKETEVRRLNGFPRCLPVPLGPPLDVGGRGPLGLLWPDGVPSWDDREWPRGHKVVGAGSWSHAEMMAASFVAFLAPKDEPEAFLRDAVAFTEDALRFRADGRAGPSPLIYIPESVRKNRPDILCKVVAAGAFPLTNADLHITSAPRSSKAFAEAANVMSRQMHDGPDLDFEELL